MSADKQKVETTSGKSSVSKAARVCLGFGAREGVCENAAGGPPRDNPLWCGDCDTARIEHISGQFAKIAAAFNTSDAQASPPPGPERPAAGGGDRHE